MPETLLSCDPCPLTASVSRSPINWTALSITSEEISAAILRGCAWQRKSKLSVEKFNFSSSWSSRKGEERRAMGNEG